MPKERWTRYQEELRNLGLYGGMKGAGGVEFRVDAGTISNGDSYKGIWYRPTRPTSIRTSLDSYGISDQDKARFGGWLAYKPLKEDWYLYIFVSN